jgi:ketosteroid isomerase-like protein
MPGRRKVANSARMGTYNRPQLHLSRFGLMTSNTSTKPYHPKSALSASHTLLWFVAGIAGMFLIVSAVFAVKLGLEGQLPFGKRSTPAPVTRPVAADAEKPEPSARPPIASNPSVTSSNGEFVSGTENLLPPEVAHLAKTTIAPGEPAAPDAAPAPPVRAAAPVTAPEPASPGPAASEAITTTLYAWAAAWERKDASAYLKHYAPDFQPARGLGRDEWAEQRRQRLSRPGEIAIGIADLDIAIKGDRATVRFSQSYRSPTQKLGETKTIELTLRDGAWLIAQERIGG